MVGAQWGLGGRGWGMEAQVGAMQAQGRHWASPLAALTGSLGEGLHPGCRGLRFQPLGQGWARLRSPAGKH